MPDDTMTRERVINTVSAVYAGWRYHSEANSDIERERIEGACIALSSLMVALGILEDCRPVVAAEAKPLGGGHGEG